jgi:hypothetical protein
LNSFWRAESEALKNRSCMRRTRSVRNESYRLAHEKEGRQGFAALPRR